MQILRTAAEVKARLRPLQRQGVRVGLVPTMGALHDGHLSLVRQIAPDVEVAVASIFVNPMQFGPKEDLAKYPRDLDGDAAKLASVGCHLVYAPTVEDVYPPGFQTAVEVAEVSQGLCGAVRPGHFRGVTTVVMKLLQIVRPDVAIFGEKDFQQLAVIRRMAFDLSLDVEIRGAPLVRDPDGLAMSSRNAYLSVDDRARALALSRGLRAAKGAYEGGERAGEVLLGLARAELTKASIEPEYLELRSFGDLAPLARADGPCVIVLAARVGSTRLLDNVILARPSS